MKKFSGISVLVISIGLFGIGFAVCSILANVAGDQKGNVLVIYDAHKNFPIVKIEKDVVTGDIIEKNGLLVNKLLINEKPSAIYIEIIPDGNTIEVPYGKSFDKSEMRENQKFIILALSK